MDEATTKLLDVLEGRPTTIDGVIAFLQGPAIELFGEDAAAQGLAEQEKRKGRGREMVQLRGVRRGVGDPCQGSAAWNCSA